MEYKLDDKSFSLSYQQLKEEYHRFCEMTDGEFMNNLPAAAHLACVICFLKEAPGYVVLSDTGIIHELIHLIHIPEGNTTPLSEIRSLFALWLKLD